VAGLFNFTGRQLWHRPVLLHALWSLLPPRSPETQELFAQLDQQLQTQPSGNLVTLGTMQWLKDWLARQQQPVPEHEHDATVCHRCLRHAKLLGRRHACVEL
jgi:hypothetical protein